MPKQKTTNISQERIEQLKKLLSKLLLNLDKSELIKLHELSNLKIINEALTHTSYDQKVNHENLEFLGDAVLRVAATEFIERKYSYLKVGERSELRAQIVSDEWLSEVGNAIEITEVFTIGPKAAFDTSARSTINAEATEALIGAIYKCLNSLTPIHSWLTPYWTEKSIEILSDPHKKNYKSALQEWSQGEGLNLPIYITEECNKNHGDSNRFLCKVMIKNEIMAEGIGPSIRKAEKEAAKNALKIKNTKNY